MFVPGILARVEEALLASGSRIESGTAIPFTAVAREAAEREVLRGCFAARSNRHNVLHSKLDILPLLGAWQYSHRLFRPLVAIAIDEEFEAVRQHGQERTLSWAPREERDVAA